MQFDVKNAAIILSVLQQIPLYYSTKTTNFFVRLRKSVEYLYNNHYLELILLWVLYGLSFFSLQTDSMFQIADSFGKKEKKNVRTKPVSSNSDIEPFPIYTGCLVYFYMRFKFMKWESKLCCSHVRKADTFLMLFFKVISCNIIIIFFFRNRKPSICWSQWQTTP